MARRGRFTSPNSGGQNLTALIVGLLRERKNAEEQALLNAYENGTAYNGAVPTAADIQAFYDDWASAAGYAPGSLEYQTIFQKKADLNNYDIKRQYNELLNTFNNTNGSNYEELATFLNDRAPESTDPQDLNTYLSKVGDINKAYIGYQGQALGRGEITASEYRALTAEILDVMDPADPKRYETLVDAYTYEWNAEKTKWDNRLTAGTVTAGQYANWAKGFQNALVAAGVKKDSVLYTTAVAAQVTASSGGGPGGAGSPVKTRIDTTLSELDTIVDIALSIKPTTKATSTSDVLSVSKDSLKALTDDPALVLMLGQALDENPNGFPVLKSLGIVDSASLNDYVGDRLSSGYADALLLVASGGPDYTKTWYDVNVTSGNMSELAQFDFQSTQWLKDVASANGNVMKIQELNNEWAKYLSGGNSKYGSLKAERLPEQFISLAQNEFEAMTGQSDGSKPTLSQTVNTDIPLDFTTVRVNKANSDAMASGKGYQQWNPEINEFEFVEGRPAGKTATGTYSFVEFAKLDGKIVPFVTSIQGVKVSDSKGNQVGWAYDQRNGSNPVVTDLKGNLVDTPIGQLNGNLNSGFVVPEGSNLSITGDQPPMYSIIGLATKTPVTFDQNNRNELALIRSGITQTEETISPDDLREAAGKVGNVIPALGGNAMAGANIAASINADANKIQTEQISASPTASTPKARAEIARLAGNTDLEKAWLFIDANKDKLELVNGGWRWKAGTAEANAKRSDALGQAAALAAPAFVAGGFTGVGAVPAAVGAGIVGFAQGLAQGKQSPLDTISDINRTILNQDPSMKTQREQFYYSTPQLAPTVTAKPPEIGDRFFRNLNGPAIPTTTGPRPGIPTPDVVKPKPAIPVPAVAPVNPMTQKYGSLTPQVTTPILQNDSTARRGGK